MQSPPNPAPLPIDEEQRLADLARYAILDTPPEAPFDRLASLAARLFKTPLALVTLVDRDRQWFKACAGPASADVGLTETGRDLSFCAHTILSGDVLVAEDLRADPRFADNPLVTGRGLRFYAGAPLLSGEGRALGTLCLLDFQPREFSGEQRAALADLAAAVVSEMELRRTAADLARSERLGRQMFADSPHPMWVFDVETLRFLAVNDAAVTHYGYMRDEFLAMTLCDIRPAEDVPALCDSRPGSVPGDTAKGVWRHRRKDGSLLWAEIASHPIEFDGRASRMVIAGDVTERRQAENALRESERRYRLLAESMEDVVSLHGLDSKLLYTSPSVFKLTGYTPAEALAAETLSHIHPDDRAALREDLNLRLGRGHNNLREVRRRRKDGSYVWVETQASPVRDARGQPDGFVSVMRDITERRRLAAEREALEGEREVLLAQTESLLQDALARADHDPLTGLLNHRAFHKCLEEEDARARADGRPLAVILLDLDNFRFFNDSYGHLSGDDVLRQVALALNVSLGPCDTLARFGGDEFALLLPDTPVAEAGRRADELRQAVGALSYRPPGYDTPIPLPLSVGIATLPDDGPDRLAALGVAAARLRVAKSGGADDSRADCLRRDMTISLEGFSMLDALVAAVDNKDRYTRRHSEDVLTYSLEIAGALGLDARTRHTVEVAALLHDVGKIGVPDAVLRKPGRLSEADFAAVKQHPLMGAVIVGAVPGFEDTLDAIRHHHERWDGGGYPFGLRGEEIPQTARLMAVADAFSAMTTDRPYRKGMDEAQALSLLQAGAGTQWDSACVCAFLGARGRPCPALPKE